MASEELKDIIVDHYLYNDTSKKDWKRVEKRGITLFGKPGVVRRFTNSVTDQSVWMFNDGEDYPLPAGNMCYYLDKQEDVFGGNEGDCDLLISFGLAEEDTIFDWHCADLVAAAYNFPAWIKFDELCENISAMYFKDGKTIEDFKAFLSEAGFEFKGSTSS